MPPFPVALFALLYRRIIEGGHGLRRRRHGLCAEGARDNFIGNRGAVHAANGTLNGCRHSAVQRIHVEGGLLTATANYFDGYHENACRVRSRRREEAEGPGETLSASLPRRLQYSSARFTIKMIFARRAAGHPTTAWRATRRVRRNFYSPRRPKSAKSSGGKIRA